MREMLYNDWFRKIKISGLKQTPQNLTKNQNYSNYVLVLSILILNTYYPKRSNQQELFVYKYIHIFLFSKNVYQYLYFVY